MNSQNATRSARHSSTESQAFTAFILSRLAVGESVVDVTRSINTANAHFKSLGISVPEEVSPKNMADYIRETLWVVTGKQVPEIQKCLGVEVTKPKRSRKK